MFPNMQNGARKVSCLQNLSVAECCLSETLSSLRPFQSVDNKQFSLSVKVTLGQLSGEFFHFHKGF